MPQEIVWLIDGLFQQLLMPVHPGGEPVLRPEQPLQGLGPGGDRPEPGYLYAAHVPKLTHSAIPFGFHFIGQ